MGISLTKAGWDVVFEGKKRKKEIVQEQDDIQLVALPVMDTTHQESRDAPTRDTPMSQLNKEDFQHEMTRMFIAMHLELKHLHFLQSEKLGVLNEKLDILNTRVTSLEGKLNQLLHEPSQSISSSQPPLFSPLFPTSLPGDLVTSPITLKEGVPIVDPSLMASIQQSISTPIETYSTYIDVGPTVALIDAVKKGESISKKEKEKEKDSEHDKEI